MVVERLTAKQKKLYVLTRLVDGDRIIRQRPDTHLGGCCPDAAWFMNRPQGSIWIGTVKWLERHGLIVESIAPAIDRDQMRRYYQKELRHRVYAITSDGYSWWLSQEWL